MPAKHIKAGIVAVFLLGLAVCVYLISRIGFAPVADAIGRVGFAGFAAIIVSGFVLSILPGLALGTLVGGPARWPVFIATRQLRDSVGDILPFTQFAGIVLGARVLVLRKCPAARVFAGSVADVTAEFVSQIAFIAIGLTLGAAQLAANPATAPYINGLMIGTGALVIGAVVFVLLQWKSNALAGFLAGRVLPEDINHTKGFTSALSQLYADPRRLVIATLLHLASWVASGVWIWIIMGLTGAEIGLGPAIAIQSLLEAFRSAAVFVPSAIGVQEAGYAALAPLFGLGPEVGLAVALLRRARDIAVGVPVLLAWQTFEGRHALKNPK